MTKLSYSLTKSKITTGLHCPQKLWFDINDKIKGEYDRVFSKIEVPKKPSIIT